MACYLVPADDSQNTASLICPENYMHLKQYQESSKIFERKSEYFNTRQFSYILKAKSNFTLLLYIPYLVIGEWYFKYV